MKHGIIQKAKLIDYKIIEHRSRPGKWTETILILQLEDGNVVESVRYFKAPLRYSVFTVCSFKGKHFVTDYEINPITEKVLNPKRKQ